MKKENNTVVFLTLNMIILSLVILNKNYKTVLEKFSKQYINLKKNNSIDSIRNGEAVQNRKLKVYHEILQKVEPVKKSIEDLEKRPILELLDCTILSKTVEDFLIDKLKEMQKMEIVEYHPFEYFLRDNEATNCMFVSNDISFLSSKANEKKIPKEFILSVAIIIYLNLWYGFIQNIDLNLLNTTIIEDIQEFIDDTIVFRFPKSFNESQKNSLKEINYEEQFALFLQEDISINQKLDKIIHSGSTDSKNIFLYILSINDLSMESKINAILNSNLTSFEEVSHFLLLNSGLSQSENMEYIIQYQGATYEEKFDFIKSEHFTLKQKIWFTLLIPNTSFQNVFNDLLTIENITVDLLLEEIIKADVVSFESLFRVLLNNDTLTKEQLVQALVYYDASYNSITLEEKVNFIFEIQTFSDQEKTEIFWKLLASYSLKDRENFILNYYNIDFQDYISILKKSDNQLTREEQMILQLYEKINEEKENYILENYAFESKEQLDAVVAGVSAEGAWSYYDLYWVSNVFFNRITDSYYSKKGINPYLQFIASKQFAVYENGSYRLYLNSSNSDYEKKFKLAKQAFYDMFYDGYDGIVHDFLSFRSWGTVDYSDTYIVQGGNRYGGAMRVSQRILYENLLKNKRTIKNLGPVKILFSSPTIK